MAEDSNLSSSRADLDAVQQALATLAAGDIATGNRLIGSVNAAKGKLGRVRQRDAGWSDLAKRANDLDAQVRARLTAKGTAPATAPSAAASSASGDGWLDKATGELDKVERELETMRPGDARLAGSLGVKLGAARSALQKSRTQSHPRWAQEQERAAALGARLQERAAAQAPAPGLAPAPVAVAAGNGPLPRGDAYILETRVLRFLKRATSQLAGTDAVALASGGGAQIRGDLASMREALSTLKTPGHPDVVATAARVDALEQALDAKVSEGTKVKTAQAAKAAATEKDVGAIIAELKSYFDEKTFTCALAPPFSEERVRDWARKLREWSAARAKGAAMLTRIVQEHPEYGKDPRVGDLRRVFDSQYGITAHLANDVPRTTRQFEERAGKLGWYLGDGSATIARTLADGDAVKRYLRELAEGLEGAQWLLAYQKEYLGAEDAGLRKQATEARSLRASIERDAVAALGGVRMPKADVNDPELVRIATAVLKDPEAGTGPFERPIVTVRKKHYTERMSESREEGDYLRITSWNEDWDDFEVAVAEKVGEEEVRIVYYLLKQLNVGPSWKPLHRWFINRRTPDARILQENVAK